MVIEMWKQRTDANRNVETTNGRDSVVGPLTQWVYNQRIG